MGIAETLSEDIVHGAQSIALSQFFSLTATGADPTYLVLDALDRNEYTVAANGDTGSFAGNGAVLSLSGIGEDGRGAGIVFTWNEATDQYVNATYGTLSQLTFTASDSADDVTNLSLFGTSNLQLATQDAGNAYALMQADPSGYLGSATIATDPGFAGAPPAQATPDALAAVAMGFVGDAWNDEGCWVLASTIAAQSGASLPVQSTAIGVPGKANGAWVVAYNGPGGSSGNWQAMVHTGEIVVIGTPGGGGHITTCVSGSGATAMLVDNITYENAYGQITNSANDGSSNDILISAPHPASQEWSGVSSNSVVIYELDTPLVATSAASATVNVGAALKLSTLFTASDPAGHAITKYQVYNTNTADTLLVGTATDHANSAATAITVASLTTVSLQAGSAASTDTVEVRAFNGTYWGDWQSLGVTVVVPPPKPPVLTTQTAAQSWKQGQAVHLVLPATLFTDPQHQALTYSAAEKGGAPLPSWLTFNPATETFTGTVPAGMAQFSIVVTATDTAGLSASETFAVTVPAAAPTVAITTPAQSWTEGSAVSLILAPHSFTDPQAEALTVKATLSSGAALPSWLHFNAATLSFTGTAPATAQTLQLKLTATDTSNLSISETISVAVVKASSALVPGDWQAGAVLAGISPAPPPAALGALIGAVAPEPAGHEWLLAALSAHHA